MKVLIAGGTGFVGRNLVRYLKDKGYHLTLLTRQHKQHFDNYDSVVTWDNLEVIDNDFDVIVNLCGYGISEKKWSENIKRKLIESRTIPTNKLIKFIGTSKTKLIHASAIGFYAFSDEQQTETNYIKNQDTFSHEIVKELEAVVTKSPIEDYQIIRFGVVLGDGGMVAKLLPSTKFGLGAVIGNGEQLISWVHIEDLCRIIESCINNQISKRLINATSPIAMSQKFFITSMSKILKRPRLLWLPKIVVKLMFGQMGEELLLSSQNIYPENLIQNDFKFKYPNIDIALQEIIRKI
ncbi:TIGR01777 family oxidoreductase [Francisellaceae bacterium]|nr:TIGR01777 family oxidoreductase [Francisellaceae bacterium]